MRSESLASNPASRDLPAGWEAACDHIDRSVWHATDSDRKRPPGNLFSFVREVMKFPWSEGWRDDPERIANLTDRLHAIHDEDFKRFMKRSEGLGTFWELYFPEVENAREEFVAIWFGMRYRPGVDPLQQAIADAEAQPVELAALKGSPTFNKIVAIAYHLQLRAGDRDILLPQQRIAGALKVSQRIVSAYAATAVQRGLLRIVSHFNYATKRATHYRFNLEGLTSNRVLGFKGFEGLNGQKR